MKSTGSREEQVQRSRSALAEVIGAGNVSDELREQASTMNLKLDVYLPTSMAELAQHCADHVGRFPNSKLHVDLMKSLVASVVKGLTSEQAIPKLEELKQAGIEQLNQAVDAKIAELQKQTSATN